MFLRYPLDINPQQRENSSEFGCTCDLSIRPCPVAVKEQRYVAVTKTHQVPLNWLRQSPLSCLETRKARSNEYLGWERFPVK